MVLALIIFTTACSAKTDTLEVKDESEEEVGFTMQGATIEAAANVPPEERDQLVAAVEQSYQLFSEQDIDGFLATLSTLPEHYDVEEERKAMEDLFKDNVVKYEPTDITVTKYTEEEAHVFTRLASTFSSLDGEKSVTYTGREVITFVKQDGQWKRASVHHLGDDPTKEQE